MYAIGIDSGTQGTKALVVDASTGRVLGKGYAPHAMITGLGPGASEQDPRTWLEALETSLAAAIKESGANPAGIVSLGVSGQQHGFVALDERGRPIRPAKLWNDTSTIAETEALVERLGGTKACIEKLGINVAVGFTASKILWLKTHEPDNYAKLATVLLPHNYLNYHLTGRLHMEYGDASGTGLMDIRALRWSDEAVNAIDPGLRSRLPSLSQPRDAIGFVRKAVAARYGLKKVLVSAGGGDNMMGAIGTGNVRPGVCTLSLGTSGTIYSYFNRPFVDPAGEIAAFCDSTGGWLPLLCTMNVTNTSELIKALFKLSNAKLEAAARKADPGSDGLLFLPFVDGERVPPLPFSSAVLFGLDRKTFDAPHLARAVIEGTVFNLGYGFARMKELGLRPAEIRATGGGSKNRLWLQAAADILGTPVVTLKEQEAAALGGALQSVWCYRLERGEKVGIEDITRNCVALAGQSAQPDPANAERYKILQDRFNSLWKTLIPEFKAHSRVIGRR